LTSPPANQPKITLSAIEEGLPSVEGKDRPDTRDLLEAEEIKTVQLQNQLARSRIKNVKADRKMRKTYAGRILRYLEIYSVVVGLFIIMAGFNLWDFSLSIEILASLVGSTALAAIGLVGFIARGLFKAPPEN
jgi:hypothetical protein